MQRSNTPQAFTACVIQHPPVYLNLEASLEKACRLVEEAANGEAQVIAFPETWLPGYPIWQDFSPKAALWDYPPAKALYRLLVENSLSIPGRHLDTLLALAHKTGTYITMGANERLGGTLYNTMIHLDRDGESYQIHRKLVPTYTERLFWGRGDGSTLGILETDYGNLGGLVCWEHWMPLARAAMHAQYETVHIAQWPAGLELHQIASRHYAFEGQCFVLVAGCTLSRGDVLQGFHSLGQSTSSAIEILEGIPGEDRDLLLEGGSAVIGPDTGYVSEPVFGRSCILYAEIEPARIVEGQFALDTSGHYARPDVLRLEVNTEPQQNVTFSPHPE